VPTETRPWSSLRGALRRRLGCRGRGTVGAWRRARRTWSTRLRRRARPTRRPARGQNNCDGGSLPTHDASSILVSDQHVAVQSDQLVHQLGTWTLSRSLVLRRIDLISQALRLSRKRVGSRPLTPAGRQTTLVPPIRPFPARLLGRLMNVFRRRSREPRSALRGR
jgi:hypothetical protein